MTSFKLHFRPFSIVCKLTKPSLLSFPQLSFLAMQMSYKHFLTGKSYWLNTLRLYSKTIGMGQDFIKTAAYTGSAAFLIGGETLHRLLSIPVNENRKHHINELELQLRLKNCGLLVIDEKSMIGQSLLMSIDKHLRMARPHKQDEIFGGLSVILIGDFKQGS